MACEATARLYDVDVDSVVFEKLDKTQKYDQGEVTFRARPGKLIDLDKLHESIRATRLSGGTRSGLVTLQVTAVGHLESAQDQVLLQVSGADAEFALAPHPDEPHAPVFQRLRQAVQESGPQVRVAGIIDDYRGYWPDVLRRPPAKPRRILVTSFEVVE